MDDWRFTVLFQKVSLLLSDIVSKKCHLLSDSDQVCLISEIIPDLIVGNTEKRPRLFVPKESAVDGLAADTTEEAGRMVGLASHSEELSSERLLTASTPG